MSVKEIEQAITALSGHELAELMTWLHEHHHRAWEAQLEEDLDAGRLDGLLEEVEKEYRAGLAKPL